MWTKYLFVQRILNQFCFWQEDEGKFKWRKKENFKLLQNSTPFCLNFFICKTYWTIVNSSSLDLKSTKRFKITIKTNFIIILANSFFQFWNLQIYLLSNYSEVVTLLFILYLLFRIKEYKNYFFRCIQNIFKTINCFSFDREKGFRLVVM